jgi:hypothetical protein
VLLRKWILSLFIKNEKDESRQKIDDVPGGINTFADKAGTGTKDSQ